VQRDEILKTASRQDSNIDGKSANAARGRVFLVTLLAPADGAIRCLRFILKRLLRQYHFRCISLEEQPAPSRRDRAALVTTALLQILTTAPAHERRQAVEVYLRDEFHDAARQAIRDIRLDDEPEIPEAN
jgi:hypothetical protein